MVALMRRTLRALRRQLARESDQSLALAINFPIELGPILPAADELLDVYHYGTEHTTTTAANSLLTSGPTGGRRITGHTLPATAGPRQPLTSILPPFSLPFTPSPNTRGTRLVLAQRSI